MDYSKKTFKELIALCKEKGCKGYSGKKKPELVDTDYLNKVQSLLVCIQKSVKEMIERTIRFAEVDMSSLLI